MKLLLLTTALAGALALPALAQTVEPFRAEMAEGNITASELIGARIYAAEVAIDGDAFEGVQPDWSDIGEVNEVILTRDGKVDSVIVDIGGFLGMGERQVAVDMTALRFIQDSATDEDDWFLVMTADRPTLEGAPEWSMEPVAAADATTAQPAAEGEAEATAEATTAEPAAPAEGEAEATAEATTAEPAAPVEGEAEATAEATTAEPAAPVEGEAEATAEATTAEPAAEDPAVAEAEPMREPTVREGYGPVDTAALTSEMLTGAEVYDSADASIGEVSDLVLTEDGQITQIVIDVGGFLGIGERRVALDMDQIDILVAEGGTEVRVYVPMDKEQLEALPPIES